jgi:hypothetical protein
MTGPSLALLHALAKEMPGRYAYKVSGSLHGGDVTIERGALEWTGMGSEWQTEVVFHGSHSDAFVMLCRHVVNAEGKS